MAANNITPKLFWVCINPPYGTENKAWNKLDARLEEFCYLFSCEHELSDAMIPVKINFYIEEHIEIFKQNDVVSTSNYLGIPKQATLNTHINYQLFSSSDTEMQFKILANGVLFLLEYWKEQLKVPKDVALNKTIEKYKEHLSQCGMYIPPKELEGVFLKSHNLFRIHFQNHLLKDICQEEILVDFVHLENYLNSKLYNTSFGESIREMYFSYDIFDFYSPKASEYLDLEKKYQYGKSKDLSIMEQFDSNHIIYQSQEEQLAYFKEGILAAVLRIKEMKRKPKHFDVDLLHTRLNDLLNDYTKNIAR